MDSPSLGGLRVFGILCPVSPSAVSSRLDCFQALGIKRDTLGPATREICQELPTIQETVVVFEANGFVLIEHRRVEQKTCGSLREFAERTELRTDSALTLISDSEFRKGQSALEQAAAHERIPLPVMEVIELLVFQSAA